MVGNRPRTAELDRGRDPIADARRLQRAGRFDSAVQAYNDAIAVDDARPDWHYRLGTCLERIDDLEGAIKAYGEAISLDSTRAVWHYRLGRAFQQSGNYLSAAESLAKAISHKGDVAKWHHRLGRCLEKINDPEAAVRSFRAAISLDDTHAIWHYRLGRALTKIGKHDDAVTELETAVALDSTHPGWYRQLGLSLERGHGINHAIETLEQSAVPGAPDGVYAYLSSARRRLGDAQRSREIAVEGLRAAGGEAWFQLVLEGARAATASFDWEAAAPAWQTVIERNENTARPHWYANLGRALEGSGLYHEAASVYRHAWQLAAKLDQPWAHAVLREWEFRTRYCDARAERHLGDDELLSVTISDAVASPEDGRKAAGRWIMAVTASGITIYGRSSGTEPETVTIHLDGRRIASLDTFAELKGGHPYFKYRINRPALATFPAKGLVELRNQRNVPFITRRLGTQLQMTVPHGDASLPGRLGDAGLLNKKGAIPDGRSTVGGNEHMIFAAYAAAKTFFEEKLDIQLFLLYGTLLGCYRDGHLLPGDDDVDLGFATTADNPATAKAQAVRIANRLLEAGFDVTIKKRGGLLILHSLGVPMSIYPLWFADGCVWGHTAIEGTRDSFVPAYETEVDCHQVLMPRDPELFLRGTYGPEWRVPSSSFRHQVPRNQLRRIRQAWLTPLETQAMLASNDNHRLHHPAIGRLKISDGSGWLLGS